MHVTLRRAAAPAWLRSLVLAALLSSPASAQAPKLTPLWTLAGLESPESVALSADGRFLYVANVGGEGDARDANGFISRVSLDGRMLETRWATGMDAPKGAALKDGRLYVSDIDRLVEIDTASGRVTARHAAPGARFLNDVAVAPDGRVLVADSGSARIYALEAGGMVVWLEDPRLRSINGILADKGRLVVTTMEGLLLSVGYPDQAIAELARDIGQGDGVVRLKDGSFLASEWPGRLFHVTPGGGPDTLVDSRKDETYINDFILAGDILYVPHWKPGSLTAYRVE
jgi:sugar lactone lactonase YvrE